MRKGIEMSEVESKKGVLIPFHRLEDETDRDYVFRFIKHKSEKIPDYWNDLEEDLDELFVDIFYRRAIFTTNGQIYVINNVINNVINMNEADIFEASRSEDESIGFFVQFYSGGMSFDEAIEEALKNVND